MSRAADGQQDPTFLFTLSDLCLDLQWSSAQPELNISLQLNVPSAFFRLRAGEIGAAEDAAADSSAYGACETPFHTVVRPGPGNSLPAKFAFGLVTSAAKLVSLIQAGLYVVIDVLHCGDGEPTQQHPQPRSIVGRCFISLGPLLSESWVEGKTKAWARAMHGNGTFQEVCTGELSLRMSMEEVPFGVTPGSPEWAGWLCPTATRHPAFPEDPAPMLHLPQGALPRFGADGQTGHGQHAMLHAAIDDEADPALPASDSLGMQLSNPPWQAQLHADQEPPLNTSVAMQPPALRVATRSADEVHDRPIGLAEKVSDGPHSPDDPAAALGLTLNSTTSDSVLPAVVPAPVDSDDTRICLAPHATQQSATDSDAVAVVGADPTAIPTMQTSGMFIAGAAMDAPGTEALDISNQEGGRQAVLNNMLGGGAGSSHMAAASPVDGTEDAEPVTSAAPGAAAGVLQRPPDANPPAAQLEAALIDEEMGEGRGIGAGQPVPIQKSRIPRPTQAPTDAVRRQVALVTVTEAPRHAPLHTTWGFAPAVDAAVARKGGQELDMAQTAHAIQPGSDSTKPSSTLPVSGGAVTEAPRPCDVDAHAERSTEGASAGQRSFGDELPAEEAPRIFQSACVSSTHVHDVRRRLEWSDAHGRRVGSGVDESNASKTGDKAASSTRGAARSSPCEHAQAAGGADEADAEHRLQEEAALTAALQLGHAHSLWRHETSRRRQQAATQAALCAEEDDLMDGHVARWMDAEVTRHRDVQLAFQRVANSYQELLQKVDEVQQRDAAVLANDEDMLRRLDALDAGQALKVAEAHSSIVRLQAECAAALQQERARRVELTAAREAARQELQEAQKDVRAARAEFSAAQETAPTATAASLQVQLEGVEAQQRGLQEQCAQSERGCDELKTQLQELGSALGVQRLHADEAARSLLAFLSGQAQPRSVVHLSPHHPVNALWSAQQPQVSSYSRPAASDGPVGSVAPVGSAGHLSGPACAQAPTAAAAVHVSEAVVASGAGQTSAAVAVQHTHIPSQDCSKAAANDQAQCTDLDSASDQPIVHTAPMEHLRNAPAARGGGGASGVEQPIPSNSKPAIHAHEHLQAPSSIGPAVPAGTAAHRIGGLDSRAAVSQGQRERDSKRHFASEQPPEALQREAKRLLQERMRLIASGTYKSDDLLITKIDAKIAKMRV